MYKPICKPNQLICSEGDTAFVTGWYPCKKFKKELDENNISYGVIGQLYSAERGIDFLVRNLLANPHISKIIILSITKPDKNTNTGRCLRDFFINGVSYDDDNRKWNINSTVNGFVNADIPLTDINMLRDSIKIYYSENKQELIERLQNGSLCQEPLSKREYRFYPFIEKEEPVIKGELYSHRIESETIAEGWVKLLYMIRTQGKIRPTGYDGKWQELINLTMVINNEPNGFHFTDYLPVDKEAIASYLPQILDDTNYVDGVKYTYGQRLRSWFGKDQIQQVIEKLIKERDSASAVMSLWDSGSSNQYQQSIARFNRVKGDSDHDNSGSPCLNHIWVRIVDDELILIALFRSNDMYSAWVSNAMGLRALQECILTQLNNRTDYNLKLGKLITISQSAHIYDDCFDSADELIKTHYKPKKIAYDDPTGNFLIEYTKEQIKVNHYAKTGELLKVYKHSNPLVILKEIAHYNPEIQPYHIGCLGSEITKAKIFKECYHQDSPD